VFIERDEIREKPLQDRSLWFLDDLNKSFLSRSTLIISEELQQSLVEGIFKDLKAGCSSFETGFVDNKKRGCGSLNRVARPAAVAALALRKVRRRGTRRRLLELVKLWPSSWPPPLRPCVMSDHLGLCAAADRTCWRGVRAGFWFAEEELNIPLVHGKWRWRIR
jgi:hypothetical protein